MDKDEGGGAREIWALGIGIKAGEPYVFTMHIVFLIIIGAAAGFIATRAMKLETGVAQTIAIGVLGAVIGSLVLRFLISITGMVAGLVGAVLGAILLIWLWRTFFS